MAALHSLNLIVQTEVITDVSRAISQGLPPDVETLDLAVATEKIEIVRLVLTAKAAPSPSTLSKACETRDIAIIKAVHDAKAEPDTHTFTTALRTKTLAVVALPFIWKAPRDENSVYEAIELMNHLEQTDPDQEYDFYAKVTEIINTAPKVDESALYAAFGTRWASRHISRMLDKIQLQADNEYILQLALEKGVEDSGLMKILMQVQPTTEVWKQFQYQKMEHFALLIGAGVPLTTEFLSRAIQKKALEFAQTYIARNGTVTSQHTVEAAEAARISKERSGHKFRATQYAEEDQRAIQIEGLVTKAFKKAKKVKKTEKAEKKK